MEEDTFNITIKHIEIVSISQAIYTEIIKKCLSISTKKQEQHEDIND